MKASLMIILIVSLCPYNLNAQIQTGTYDFRTLKTPKVQDYGTVYRDVGNQLNMQYSNMHLPDMYRFKSHFCRESSYNLVTEMKIDSVEFEINTTIYIDYDKNKLTFETDENFEVYDFMEVETKFDKNDHFTISGILPNLGRYSITQYADNRYIIMTVIRAGKLCTVRSYKAYMDGSK